MSQKIIAGIYEIQNQIGAGGGGVVYLGIHTRLNKQVVLKADKRTLSTRPEVLRREVDLLKGLSHTYIPQVYDFIQEDGVVYTVMDYIGGESLDKLIERNEKPSQPQLIKWACQILEALIYLHGRPPHGILHGDIKPANIMLRYNGDICLIDYNIALALGENGAVKVGFSRGYASPEHYGIEYVRKSKITLEDKYDDKTQADDTNETDKTIADSKAAANSTNTVMLDARSDLYSLGATLYHLISGHKPPQNAIEVEPLGADICSPQISKILQKAMQANPDMRYQSAKEMLDAFLNIYKTDERVVRHKRHVKISAVSLSALFIAGALSTFIGLKQLEQFQNALALSEYSANALNDGDISKAVELAIQAMPDKKSILDAPVTPQAQKALTDALGVYDLADGYKSFDVVNLPAAPFKLAASPSGKYFAAVYAYEASIFDMETCQKIDTLPIQKSAASDVLFINDTCVIFAGENGVTCYDTADKKVIWTKEKATTITVSEDKKTAACVNKGENKAYIYNISDGSLINECYFGGLSMTTVANDTFADYKNDIFRLNQDGSMLAVSFSNGALTLFDLQNADNDIILYDQSDYTHFDGGFCGKYFTFTASKSGESVFSIIDTKKTDYVGGYESRNSLKLSTDENGIYLADGNLLVKIDPKNMSEKELAYTDNQNITGFCVGERYVLTATDNKEVLFYDSGANVITSKKYDESCDFTLLTGGYAILGNRNEPTLRIMKLENHEKSQLLTYDARYEHDEARISADMKTVMLFDYKKFRIYDMDGNILAEKELPDAGNIYDQQFVRDGNESWLEVTWYDGMIKCYSADTGEIISEKMIEAPSRDLYEEFITDRYRITSELHGTPEVYDLKSGKSVGFLEKDSYLTYVSQMENYIMAEYISAEGKRYGTLLDENLQVLAYLPNLCDVVGDTLIFDYSSGNLRQSRLYSLQELMTLGETYTIK